MNLNDLAKEVTELEGGKVSLPIGQVKEVLRIALTIIANKPMAESGTLIKRYIKK